MSVTTRPAALVFACIGLIGCQLTASHEEYESYRRIRLATSSDAALLAMRDYAREYPSGPFSDEVARERSAREPAYWHTNKESAPGLARYLRAYPDGRFVAQARPRLVAMTTVDRRRNAERERRAAHHAQRRAEALAARRSWVTRALTFWTKTALGIRNYGASIRRVASENPRFSEAFGRAPTPVCERGQCRKHYRQRYFIPQPGATRLERTVDVFLRVRLADGRLKRMEMLLPGRGFSRWYEVEHRVAVDDDDEAERQRALSWALDQIVSTIREAAPNPTVIEDYVPEPVAALNLTDRDRARYAGEPRGPAGRSPAAASARSRARASVSPAAGALGSGQGGGGAKETPRPKGPAGGDASPLASSRPAGAPEAAADAGDASLDALLQAALGDGSSDPLSGSMLPALSGRRAGGVNPPSAQPVVEDTSASPPLGRTNTGLVALGPKRSALVNHAPGSPGRDGEQPGEHAPGGAMASNAIANPNAGAPAAATPTAGGSSTAVAEAADSDVTLSLPVLLIALRAADLRVVAFAASEAGGGPSLDGIWVEPIESPAGAGDGRADRL